MKLTDDQLKDRIWNNTLNTCEYLGGYVNRTSLVQLKCVKHNYYFETAYENVGRASRPHLVCPLCKEEQLTRFDCKCE